MHSSQVERILTEANKKLRTHAGPNFYFKYDKKERQFQLWEKRGPLTQMVFPLNVGSWNIPFITDIEIRMAKQFVLRRRKDRDRDYYKYKEYNKILKPNDYVDWRPTDDASKWVDSSPRDPNYKKVSVPIHENTHPL